MIEPSPGLPPHIALLLNEDFDFADHRLALRKLKGMLRDLKDQADISEFEPLGEQGGSPSEFRASLSGGLDLFSGMGACQMPVCRIGYAEQVSRSIALMADKVTAHDYLYERIHHLRVKASNEELIPLLDDVVVLKTIQPLIEAGIFRFTLPISAVCSLCIATFESRVEFLTEHVISSFRGEIAVERGAEYSAVDLSPVYEPALVVRISPNFSEEHSDEELVRYFVSGAVRSILWDARSASSIGGSVFSNSSAGISALLAEDGRGLSSSELRAFAADRSAELPWVSGLSVQQTLDLREEASSALPAFREFMARRLCASSAGVDVGTWMDAVGELREQAVQVRQELDRSTSRSLSLRRNATGILGLGVSAVCFATEGPGSGLAGLLGTLGLIHSIPEPGSTHSSLRAKPGYVLVAAQDILQHST
jgi:hypothetical protein